MNALVVLLGCVVALCGACTQAQMKTMFQLYTTTFNEADWYGLRATFTKGKRGAQ